MKKQNWAIVMGIFYLLAGLNHFLMPQFYMQIMPPYLPYHKLLIYLSGIAEATCGIFLMISKLRRIGAWLTILLLIAVFPANIQMTINEYSTQGNMFYLSILRLPLQFLLIWLAYLFTKSSKA